MRALLFIGSLLVILGLMAAVLQAAAHLAMLLFCLGAAILLFAVVVQDFRRHRHPPE